jgi:hypothetical protein
MEGGAADMFQEEDVRQYYRPQDGSGINCREREWMMMMMMIMMMMMMTMI